VSNYSSASIEQFAQVFKALSSPNRLRILARLISRDGTWPTSCADVGTCKCVGEIGKDLDIAPSTVSHHIKELHRVGLIGLKRRGQNVECWIDYEALESLADFLSRPGESHLDAKRGGM